MNKEQVLKTRKTISYLLLLIVVLYIITGFGITQWQVVEPMTFGILTKAVSFKVHSVLIYPLIILIIIHIILAITFWRGKK